MRWMKSKDMPLTNLRESLKTFEVLFAADKSAEEGGRLVKLSEVGRAAPKRLQLQRQGATASCRRVNKGLWRHGCRHALGLDPIARAGHSSCSWPLSGRT